MITCSRCGFHNLDGTETCVRCQGGLGVRVVAFDLPTGRRRIMSLLIGLFRPITLLRYRVTAFARHPPAADLPYRDPALAAWMSLVPGLGQVYNSQWRMGLVYALSIALLVVAGILLILSPLGDLCLLLAVLLLLHGINQAMTEAHHINGSATFLGGRRWLGFIAMLFFSTLLWFFVQYFAIAWVLLIVLAFGSVVFLASWSGRQRRGESSHAAPALFLLGWIALACTMFFGPPWLWHSVVRLQYHSQHAFQPLLMKGDRLLIETISFAWRDVDLGDIVYYDPGRYSTEMPAKSELGSSTIHVVNMTANVERVVGLPGDVIERRAGVFYRNGQPAPPLHQPLVQDELPFDYAFEVPPGCYAIMMSYGPWEWMPLVGDRKAMPPNASGVGPASIIEREDIYGRVRMIFYPWARRRFLEGVPPIAGRPGG